MKNLKYLFLALFISLSQFSFAQTEDLLYPDLVIVSQTKEQGKLTYVLQRWGLNFNLELAKTNQTISIKLTSAEGDVLALGNMGKQGIAQRKLVLRRSTRGLTAFWHFAMDRTRIDNGKFGLVALMEEGAPLWTCQMCCYESYLMDPIAEEDEYAKAQIADGVAPKDWKRFFELNPKLFWEEYNNCVDACLTGGECSDYSW